MTMRRERDKWRGLSRALACLLVCVVGSLPGRTAAAEGRWTVRGFGLAMAPADDEIRTSLEPELEGDEGLSLDLVMLVEPSAFLATWTSSCASLPPPARRARRQSWEPSSTRWASTTTSRLTEGWLYRLGASRASATTTMSPSQGLESETVSTASMTTSALASRPHSTPASEKGVDGSR